eukprot:179624-Chlamydomonas_euryale.AAC.2
MRSHVKLNGWPTGQPDRRTDGRTIGQMNGWMDGCVCIWGGGRYRDWVNVGRYQKFAPACIVFFANCIAQVAEREQGRKSSLDESQSCTGSFSSARLAGLLGRARAAAHATSLHHHPAHAPFPSPVHTERKRKRR